MKEKGREQDWEAIRRNPTAYPSQLLQSQGCLLRRPEGVGPGSALAEAARGITVSSHRLGRAKRPDSRRLSTTSQVGSRFFPEGSPERYSCASAVREGLLVTTNLFI